MKENDFPIALDVFSRAVSLPIYPKMTDEDVSRVIEAVKVVSEQISKPIKETVS